MTLTQLFLWTFLVLMIIYCLLAMEGKMRYLDPLQYRSLYLTSILFFLMYLLHFGISTVLFCYLY